MFCVLFSTFSLFWVSCASSGVVSCVSPSVVVFSCTEFSVVFSCVVLSEDAFSVSTSLEVPITSFILLIPWLLIVSNVKSNTKTIAAVISTITITAIVLFTNCFGVGQITFFNSALNPLKKLFLFF